MDNLELLIDLHRDAERQGPGGEEETELSITLSGLDKHNDLQIVDIGCGTGASTLVLARVLDCSVTAIDFIPEFLSALDTAAQRMRLDGRIKTLRASMDALDFEEQTLDAIWSEGAIYNMGFENGVRTWRRFLKPGGVLAVSELTWLTDQRPSDLDQHWQREYSEVDTASNKLAVLEACGYSPIGYFALPKRCWLENYYHPMEDRFADFIVRNGNSTAARDIVKAERAEIDLYRRNADFVSYGYYIARKTGA